MYQQFDLDPAELEKAVQKVMSSEDALKQMAANIRA